MHPVKRVRLYLGVFVERKRMPETAFSCGSIQLAREGVRRQLESETATVEPTALV